MDQVDHMVKMAIAAHESMMSREVFDHDCKSKVDDIKRIDRYSAKEIEKLIGTDCWKY